MRNFAWDVANNCNYRAIEDDVRFGFSNADSQFPTRQKIITVVAHAAVVVANNKRCNIVAIHRTEKKKKLWEK